MQAGFHGAHRDGGDDGDFLEREFFEDMEQQRGSLGRGQLLHQDEKSRGVFRAHQLGPGIIDAGIHEVVRLALGVGKYIAGASIAPQVLQAALVGDAEKPGDETGIIAQGADVPNRSNEGFLDDVERGVAVADEFGHIGIERQLALFEKGVPGVGIVATGSLKQVG